jgi:EmrB/QacA subfamily drug resistance transporter
LTTSGSIEELNQRNRLRIITGVLCASFLAALDTTILATAMPTIVTDLGGLRHYSWVFSVYMIMTAISTPVWGKLIDTFGKRPMFFASVCLFLLGSVLCGQSNTMTQLIIFRGVQGLGSGGLASVPFALISTVFPPHERGKALGFLSSTWGISSVIGPIIGSFLVTHFTWRWVFYVNIPGAIAALAIVAASYHEEERYHKEQIDYLGAAFLCLAIVSLLLATLAIGEGRAITSSEVMLTAAGCAVTTMLFVRREQRAVSPLLELTFFRERAFWVGNLIGFLASFAVFGVITYIPLFAYSVLSNSSTRAGIVVTLMSLAWSSSSILAGRLVYRVGERLLITTGMGVMLGGFVLLLFTSSESTFLFLSLCVVVMGFGMGMQTPSLMLSVQHSVDAKHIGVATSTQMLARTIGGAIGVSVMGATVTATMLKEFADLAARGALSSFAPQLQSYLTQPQELLASHVRVLMSEQDLSIVLAAFSGALHNGFVVGLLATILGIAVSFLLPASVLHTLKRASEMSSR